MYSPTFKPDQHSPLLSPIPFRLDDGANGIQRLLLSPTKPKMDSGGRGDNSIYRTSLSKLNELTRSGRSKQRRGSDSFRSTSPIRFPLMGNSFGPKMLRPEYIAPQNPSLPLLSTLMKSASAASKSQAKKSASKKVDVDPVVDIESFSKLSIKDTLEQLNIQKQRHVSDGAKITTSARSENTKQTPALKSRAISHADSTMSGSTVYENSSGSESSELLKMNATKMEETKTNLSHPKKTQKTESSSNLNLILPDTEEIPQEINMDMLPTDRNGFVQLNNNKNNRYSFISSTSTDLEVDWYNHLQQQQNIQSLNLQQPSPRFPTTQSESDGSVQNEKRIKRLEVEIAELKKLNEKLLKSMENDHVMSTKSEANKMHSSQNASHRHSNKRKPMQLKVRKLEKKLESYRIMMDRLVDMHATLNNSVQPHDEETGSVKTRISRISDVELKRIEEARSSSSEESSETPSETPSEDENDGEMLSTSFESLENLDYIINHALSTQDDQQSVSELKRNSVLSNKKPNGLHLNLQIERN